MDSNTMRSEFDIKLDIISNNSTPGLTDEEVSIMLTRGQENIVKNILDPTKDKLVDLTELSRKELSTLYVNATLSKSSTQTGAYTNGYFWDVPTNHYFTLNLNATLSSGVSCLDGKILNVKPVTYDEYNINIGNPYKQPGRNVVWVLQAGLAATAQRLQTINSAEFTDITSLRIAYIKQPADIVADVTTPGNMVDSELPVILHSRVVDEAVELAKLQLGLLNEYQGQKIYNEDNK